MWTITGDGVLLRNGVDSFGRAPQLSLRLVNGVLTLSAFAFTQQWYSWIGGTWVFVGPNEPGLGSPTVTPPRAPTNLRVIPGGQ